MAKVIIFVVIFIAGYIVGAREGTEEIRLGDLERILLYSLALGVGIGLVGFIGYVFYHRPVKKKLFLQEQEIENGRATLQREKDKFDRERIERIRTIVQNNEEIVRENSHQALKEAEISQRRQIEEEVENRFRLEIERLPSRGHQSMREEKRLKKPKTIYSKPQTYRASNGKIFAKLREGAPLKKS